MWGWRKWYDRDNEGGMMGSTNAVQRWYASFREKNGRDRPSFWEWWMGIEWFVMSVFSIKVHMRGRR